MLRALEASDRSLVSVGRCTTQQTRAAARAHRRGAGRDLDGEEVTKLLVAAHDAIDRADALVLEDYNKGVLVAPVIRACIDQARARGIPIVVDPKFRNFFGYGGATIFKPNRRELEAALGAAVDADHPEALPRTLERLGVEHILLTLGERGMALFSAHGEIARVRPRSRTSRPASRSASSSPRPSPPTRCSPSSRERERVSARPRAGVARERRAADRRSSRRRGRPPGRRPRAQPRATARPR